MKYIKPTLIFLLIFFGLFSVKMNAQNDNFFAEYDKFKSFYENELKNAGIVGSSFVFLKDNKVIAQDFYGFQNLEKNQTADENTIYHWASNTKPFTGIAIMQLRDHGLLKLDDPVTKYLPELEKVYNPFGKMSEITIRNLMNRFFRTNYRAFNGRRLRSLCR